MSTYKGINIHDNGPDGIRSEGKCWPAGKGPEMKGIKIIPAHGGAREGAGRKPGQTQPSASRTVRLPVTDWEYLDGTGNASGAVREAIALHRKKNNNKSK